MGCRSLDFVVGLGVDEFAIGLCWLLMVWIWWLVAVCQLVKNVGLWWWIVVGGWWQIDGGFCHGLVVSWWLGWLDTTVSGGGAVRSCGLKRGIRQRDKDE